MIYACRLRNLAIVEQVRAQSDLLWGHATLVVPHAWSGPIAANHAVIGWNGSAQAAAAVRNALPLLKRAKNTTVLLGPPREALPDSVQTSLLDVVAYLQRHGIVATERASINDEDAGQEILAAAEENKADIVVMGAFGRSRFNEWILGGATRDCLAI